MVIIDIHKFSGTVRTFCIDSGSHTIHHCLTSDARDSEQGACLDRALEVSCTIVVQVQVICEPMFPKLKC